MQCTVGAFANKPAIRQTARCGDRYTQGSSISRRMALRLVFAAAWGAGNIE